MNWGSVILNGCLGRSTEAKVSGSERLILLVSIAKTTWKSLSMANCLLAR